MRPSRHRTIAARSLLALAFAAGTLVAAPAQGMAATLSERVAANVQRSPVRGSTYVVAWDQRTREIFYTRRADEPIAPASNMKLLTSAAALQRFGPDHRFTTRVAMTGRKEGTTWVGSIYLVGGGDPSLSTRRYRNQVLGGVGSNLGSLVGPVRALGIRTITGRLYVDESYLDDARYVGAWKPSFRYSEVPALGALTVNESGSDRGVVRKALAKAQASDSDADWTALGRSAIRAPAIHAGETFRSQLRAAGITVRGGTIEQVMPDGADVVGTLNSPPLADLLLEVGRDSNNFHAEILLRQIGRDVYGPGKGTTALGARAARYQLKGIGVPVEDLRWVDGSGLAYSNRVTARLLANVLGVGAQAEWWPQWRASLARSGVAGTLAGRMTRRPYRGNVRGKTGTLRHVSALSGFSTRASGRDYGFVVVTWRSDGAQLDYSRTRALQDRIASTLVR